jgi:putative glutamine amidotransferase
MIKKLFIIFGLLLIFLSSCSKKNLTIAVSKGAGSESYDNYCEWIKSFDSEAECIDLYFIDRNEAMEIIEEADGLILSGGPDVHPGRYGEGQDTARCSIDLERDTLEFALIEYAMEKEIPILGICRGQQILNVAMRGSLIVDIPEDTDSKVIHQDKDNPNVMHNVKVFENSRLYAMSAVSNYMVNSNHHQGIGELAPVFKSAAASDDGLIEAYEYQKNDMPYLIAVAWHPERLPRKHPLAYSVGWSFIQAAKEYKVSK